MSTSRRGLTVLEMLLSILLLVAPMTLGAPVAVAAGAAPTQTSPVPASPPGPDANPLPPPLGVAEGILVDPSNGKVLWEENDTVPRAPASLTKVVTAMVVLQRANLDAIATVTPDAAAVGGSETEAPAGVTMTVRDMLWGLLLVSGNDMAVALAHAISPDGTVAGFVQLMNADATAVGAGGSTFVNPHGLPAPGHLTTARDLALITMVDMKNPTFAQMVGTLNHSVVWGGTPHLLTNHNKLLTLFPGTIGVKTGYTGDAGWTLDSEVTRGGRTLLAVVLNTNSPAGYHDSEALYNWGFANLAALEAQSTDTIVPRALPPGPHLGTSGQPGSPARRVASTGRTVAAHHAITVNGVLILVLLGSFGMAVVLSYRRNEGRRG
jgi:D-alanyl-D-alanine carboxypeptidase (penicillin-binding protein 5/6)